MKETRSGVRNHMPEEVTRRSSHNTVMKGYSMSILDLLSCTILSYHIAPTELSHIWILPLK